MSLTEELIDDPAIVDDSTMAITDDMYHNDIYHDDAPKTKLIKPAITDDMFTENDGGQHDDTTIADEFEAENHIEGSNGIADRFELSDSVEYDVYDEIEDESDTSDKAGGYDNIHGAADIDYDDLVEEIMRFENPVIGGHLGDHRESASTVERGLYKLFSTHPREIVRASSRRTQSKAARTRKVLKRGRGEIGIVDDYADIHDSDSDNWYER